MSPLNVGLLLLGAALSSGLAVKMSPPLSITTVAATSVTPAPAAPVSATVARSRVVSLPSPLPSPLPSTREYEASYRKPSPFAAIAASAPPPVYLEPPEQNEANLTSKASPSTTLTLQLVPPLPYRPPMVAYTAPPELRLPELHLPFPLFTPLPVPRRATLKTGISIPIRLNESLPGDRSLPGDTFNASLAEPLVVDGLIIAERGARATGRIVNALKAGRFTGTSLIELELVNIYSSDGQTVGVSTDRWMQRGDTTPAETIRFRLVSKVTITERLI